MDKVAIGSRLREARNIAKLTQEQLAEKVGIGTTYISDIERGAKFPSLSLFIKIVDALGESSDLFFAVRLKPVRIVCMTILQGSLMDLLQSSD